ncbi:MAG TPA: excinuclease ABC subunit UvrC [Polyangia bacterium]|nr:excinuclease ABC subunit UvrC [Polyangia bacterium]
MKRNKPARPPQQDRESENGVPTALQAILDGLPEQPGVYLMKDKRAHVIYIGKAARLRDRVRQYFHKSSDNRDFVPLLAGLVGDIETIVTNNEKEALLLENNLIKQHQPKFNVKLVDDKNFLVLRLDPSAKWPRLEVGRRIKEDGARYFGPYHSATACREALRVVNRHFKLRTCTDHVLNSRKRPCLQYQIKRCDAPCVFPIPVEGYQQQVDDVTLFLQGKDDELLSRLKARMREAAGKLEYEGAAAIRDQLQALEKSLEQQRVVATTFVDQDVVGLHRAGTTVELSVLFIRQGKLLGRRTFSFKNQEFPDAEVVSSFIGLYYDMSGFQPDEVLLPVEIPDAELKADWLREKRGRKVEVLVPQRGPRHDLVVLAGKNAQAEYESRRDHQEDAIEALGKLQRRLHLKRLPQRIECYDIANLQGQLSVGSMVVFVDGVPDKSQYRIFKIKTVKGPDDFASLYEVLSRRFRRAKQDDPGWAVPDLVVVDGGKGQLQMALAAAHDVGIPTGVGGIDMVGIAKPAESAQGEQKPDRVFIPKIKDPIKLRPNSAELFVLARVRDEAHRFANTLHRKLRRRRALRSALEDVPGIGAKRKRELLRHFGSLKKIKEATIEDLARAPGMTAAAAQSLFQFFHPPEDESVDENAEGGLDLLAGDAESADTDGDPTAGPDETEAA